jgi:hypothetical protein
MGYVYPDWAVDADVENTLIHWINYLLHIKYNLLGVNLTRLAQVLNRGRGQLNLAFIIHHTDQSRHVLARFPLSLKPLGSPSNSTPTLSLQFSLPFFFSFSLSTLFFFFQISSLSTSLVR